MALIKDRKLAADSWLKLDAGAKDAPSAVSVFLPASGDVLVPLAVWQAQRAQLIAREGGLGVWLAGNDDPEGIAADFEHFDVIAVQFPSFTDGRGYSIGRLLRQRYGWRGELRAFGDVQRDQLSYLTRCGFDAFVLREGEDAEVALAAFNDFSDGYQASVERPLPLFRRRHVAGAGPGA